MKIFSLDEEMKMISEIQYLKKKKIKIQQRIDKLKKSLNKKLKGEKYV